MTRKALIAAAAAGGVVLLGLLLLPLRSHDIAGVVRVGSTGEPMPGVDVWVRYQTWGIVEGQLVWDESHVFPTVTGPAGTFRISYRGPSNVELNVRADGYEWFQKWTGGSERIDVVLEVESAPLPEPPPMPVEEMSCDELEVASSPARLDLGIGIVDVSTVVFETASGLWLYPIRGEVDPAELLAEATLRDGDGTVVEGVGVQPSEACPEAAFLAFQRGSGASATFEIPSVRAAVGLTVRPG